MIKRDLQSLFNVRNLPTDDEYRLIWWTKGIYGGFVGNSVAEVPVEYILDYHDGLNFGNELYNTKTPFFDL